MHESNPTDPDAPVPTLVIYRPKDGSEGALRDLVQRHWPAVHATGLTTEDVARTWKATDHKSGKVAFVELFEWKDADAPRVAHETPEVMALWEPMGQHLAGLEIYSVEALPLADGAS